MTLTNIFSDIMLFLGDILPGWTYYVLAVIVIGLAAGLLYQLNVLSGPVELPMVSDRDEIIAEIMDMEGVDYDEAAAIYDSRHIDID